MADKLDTATLGLMRTADKHIDPESFNLKVEAVIPQLGFCLWGNIVKDPRLGSPHPLNHLPSHLLTHLLTHPPTHPLTHSTTHSFTHLLTHSSTNSLIIHSHTHSSTHSLTLTLYSLALTHPLRSTDSLASHLLILTHSAPPSDTTKRLSVFWFVSYSFHSHYHAFSDIITKITALHKQSIYYP